MSYPVDTAALARLAHADWLAIGGTLKRNRCAVTGTLPLEQLVHLRVLVFVLDLPAAIFLAYVRAHGDRVHVVDDDALEGEGEVAGGRGARVEMLVILVVPGREDTALFPVDFSVLRFRTRAASSQRRSG